MGGFFMPVQKKKEVWLIGAQLPNPLGLVDACFQVKAFPESYPFFIEY